MEFDIVYTARGIKYVSIAQFFSFFIVYDLNIMKYTFFYIVYTNLSCYFILNGLKKDLFNWINLGFDNMPHIHMYSPAIFYLTPLGTAHLILTGKPRIKNQKQHIFPQIQHCQDNPTIKWSHSKIYEI